MLWYTWKWIYLLEILFSFPLGVYPEVELLDHMVDQSLIFCGTCVLFSIVVEPTSDSHQQCMQVPFLLHPHQYLLSLIFLIIAILTGVKWYFIMVLVYVSQMFGFFFFFFMCLLAILMFSLENCLFNSFAHVKIRFFLVEWGFYIFWRLTPYLIYDLQNFSPFSMLSFDFVNCSFCFA